MRKAKIYYARMDELWRKEQKLDCLEEFESVQDVVWQEIEPDKKYVWLTEGLKDDFDSFISLGSKEAKALKGEATDCIFKIFSNGIKTNRDTWAYNFSCEEISNNIQRMIATYNEQVIQLQQRNDKSLNVDDFVVSDETRISWSSTLKNYLKAGTQSKYVTGKIRCSLYRPFCLYSLYFDEIFNDRRGQFPLIFPTSETENRVVCISYLGITKPFHCVMTRVLPDFHLTGDSLCLPFYTYDKDGTNRRENITDWSLALFQTQYKDLKITKWDIFHYIYAIIPTIAIATPPTSNANYRASPLHQNFRILLSQENASPKSISTTNNNPNIASNILRTKTSRSIGESKKCASVKTKPKSNIMTFSPLQAFHQKP